VGQSQKFGLALRNGAMRAGGDKRIGEKSCIFFDIKRSKCLFVLCEKSLDDTNASLSSLREGAVLVTGTERSCSVSALYFIPG